MPDIDQTVLVDRTVRCRQSIVRRRIQRIDDSSAVVRIIIVSTTSDGLHGVCVRWAAIGGQRGRIRHRIGGVGGTDVPVNLVKQWCLIHEGQNACLSRKITSPGTLCHGEPQVSVMIAVHGDSQLLEVVLALSATSGFACLLNGRQQQGNQNGDNRNHDQQFDQRKTAVTIRSRHDGKLPKQDLRKTAQSRRERRKPQDYRMGATVHQTSARRPN